jgi:hypothetical protein
VFMNEAVDALVGDEEQQVADVASVAV